MIDELIAALKDRRKEVRAQAAEALGRTGDGRAVPALVMGLTDRTNEVRERSLSALRSIGPAGIDELIAAWSTTVAAPAFQSPIAATLEEILAELGVLAGERLLLRFEDSDTPRPTRLAIMRLLRRLGVVSDKTPLLKSLNDKDYFIRSAAIRTLSTVGSVPVEYLLAALGDSYAPVRSAATQALGSLRDIRFMDPLVSLLSDPTKDVRRSAVDALGRINDIAVLKPLLSVLHDNSFSVRIALAEVLGGFQDIDAAKSLIQLLGDPDRRVARHAAKSLMALGSMAVPLLKEALFTAEWSSGIWRAWASTILGTPGPWDDDDQEPDGEDEFGTSQSAMTLKDIEMLRQLREDLLNSPLMTASDYNNLARLEKLRKLRLSLFGDTE